MATGPGGDAFDVVVIGGGPAGGAAARAAAAVGVRVLLLEERPLDPAASAAMAGDAAVTVRDQTRVWGLFPDLTVAATGAGGTWTLRPQAVIVATGSTDRPCPIPGWHLPGTLTMAGVRAALADNEIAPGTRVAIVSAATDGDPLLGSGLREAGATVVARVVAAGAEVVGPDRGVTAIRVPGGTIPCDRVILDGGRQARFGLAQMAGCAVRLDGGGFIPVVDDAGRTVVPGLLVAGDAVGPCSEAVARAEGRLAGAVAAGGDAGSVTRAREVLARLDPTRDRAEIAATPDIPIAPTTVLCRCEGIVTAAVDAAIAAGATSVNDVKRRTRAGMGSCQGSLCVPLMAGRLGEAGIAGGEALAPMTARPPVLPITVGELAALDPASAPAPR